MNTTEIIELSSKTKEDGQRLFGVSDALYKIAITLNWTLLIIGGLPSIYLIVMGLPYEKKIGALLLILVVGFCAINYVIAVLTTHVSKVLVHISYSTLGTLHLIEKLRSESLASNPKND